MYVKFQVKTQTLTQAKTGKVKNIFRNMFVYMCHAPKPEM